MPDLRCLSGYAVFALTPPRRPERPRGLCPIMCEENKLFCWEEMMESDRNQMALASEMEGMMTEGDD